MGNNNRIALAQEMGLQYNTNEWLAWINFSAPLVAYKSHGTATSFNDHASEK